MDIYLKFYKQRFLQNENYFFISLLDIQKKVQFSLFIDCKDSNLVRIVFLERFSIVNKIWPSLAVEYGTSLNKIKVGLNFNENAENLSMS